MLCLCFRPKIDYLEKPVKKMMVRIGADYI